MSHKIKLRFFQPSWFQIQTENLVIYIDPAYLKKYYTNFPTNKLYTTWPQPIDGLPDESLPKADLIFITHHHKDHCKKVTIERLRKKDTILIAPKICKKELGKVDAEVQPGDIRVIKGVTFSVTHAYNTPNGSSTKKQHKKEHGVGYILSIKNTSIYHAGDTDLIPEMHNFSKLDIALLPVGGTMQEFIFEYYKKRLKPKVVIPMHNMKTSAIAFAEAVNKETNSIAIPLLIGEEYYI